MVAKDGTRRQAINTASAYFVHLNRNLPSENAASPAINTTPITTEPDIMKLLIKALDMLRSG